MLCAVALTSNDKDYTEIMVCVVQKFGGTSVATVPLIHNAALHVARELNQGASAIVVVSAMAGMTDQLVAWAREAMGDAKLACDYDAVLASGEQITSGLMALALQRLGFKARAWQGWQLPIRTSSEVSVAQIKQINVQFLQQNLGAQEVVVVPGFQGVSSDGRITTLGRGGSDTTAVALAAACHADWCDIYTDVDGVYSADPRLIPYVRKRSAIDYISMLELAAQGARVLHPRSVEIAYRCKVRLRVLSSFIDYQPTTGTWIVEPGDIEYRGVIGIATKSQLAQVVLRQLMPPQVAAVMSTAAATGIAYDVSYTSEGELRFILAQADVGALQGALAEYGMDMLHQGGIAKVTLVGVSLAHDVTIMEKLWKMVQEQACHIMSVMASESAYSLFTSENNMALLARHLHEELIEAAS
jgi:aspartate kinase